MCIMQPIGEGTFPPLAALDGLRRPPRQRDQARASEALGLPGLGGFDTSSRVYETAEGKREIGVLLRASERCGGALGG
jgi:hypothetical protein